MIPGWIVGYYQLDKCCIDLQALAAMAHIKFVQDKVVDLDADRCRVCLSGGEQIKRNTVSRSALRMRVAR
jgi:NADH dehydrogenase FAD-containing subunit